MAGGYCSRRPAIVNRPPLILADEPTGNLDEKNSEQIHRLLMELNRELSMTMVVVTHEMGFAREVADRVIFMDEGAIVEEGTPEHFFTDPTHDRTKLFLSQIL